MISSVKKVQIQVPADLRKDALLKLQQSKSVMLNSVEDATEIDLSFEEGIISRSEIVIKNLSSYIKQGRKIFKTPTVDYVDFVASSNKRIETLEKIEKLLDDRNFLKSENAEEEKLIKEVENFKGLDFTTKELSETTFTTFFFGRVPDIKWEIFLDYTVKNNVVFDEFAPSDLGHNILVIGEKQNEIDDREKLLRLDFEEIKIPLLDVKIKDYINAKQDVINKNNKSLTEIEEILAKSHEHDLEIKVLADQMRAQIARKKVVSKIKNDVAHFYGFIEAEKEDEVTKILADVSNEAVMRTEAVTEFDKVPTLLKNKKVVQPFESIMNTYSVPNHTEVDPSPVMAFWYWLFFGLMIGDIGYGLILIVVMGLFLKIKKPKGSFGSLVRIFFYSGFTALFAGIIYGSFFGENFDLLKLINPNWTSVIVNPKNDPMKMLFFSIGLGILHLSSGLVMKIILSFKRKQYFEALARGFSWLFILIGLSLFAINMLTSNAVPVMSTVGLVLIVLGVVLILLFSGWKSKSVFGKITGGFGGIFKATSYLSDILSYSRILALALSGAIIGNTFNKLAQLVPGIVGILVSPFIYIIGHVFTLVISMLSAYVHGSRLEYLEFFGKFFEGGGYLFVPLQFETVYVDVIN